MRRNRHRGQGVAPFGRRVQQQKPIHGPFRQHPRVLLHQFGLPVVAGGKVKVVRAQQIFLDALHHQRKVAFAQIRSDYAD
jgi:hypothetical protein